MILRDRFHVRLSILAVVISICIPMVSAAQNNELLNRKLRERAAAATQQMSDVDALQEFRGEYLPLYSLYLLTALSGKLQEIQLERGPEIRTDQQRSASAGVNGTTSLVEKAGLPSLLALAVDYGALQQNNNGTSFTLSTTPYAAVALAEGDTAENFNKFEWLHRVGLGATFPIDDNAKDLSLTERFSDVSQVSVKLHILGERDHRSQAVTELWHKEFGPRIDEILAAETAAMDFLFNDSSQAPFLYQVYADSYAEIKQQLDNRLRSGAPLPEDTIYQLMRQQLDPILGDPIRDGTLALKPSEQEKLGNAIIPRFLSAEQGLFGEGGAYAEQYTALLKKASPYLFTVDWSMRFVESGSDISDAKALFEYGFGQLDIRANGTISFNHSPGAGQDTVRSFGGTLGLEYAFFPRWFASFGPSTLSLAGAVNRSEDSDNTVGNAQLRLSLPIAVGVEVPLAVTYSSRTDKNSNDEWKVNLGANFGTEKLLSWLRIGELAEIFGGRAAVAR